MTAATPASPAEGRVGGRDGAGANHLPALDGLRAVAVLSVVAYHLGLPWARGGYLGVDLFFVLSGFLITGLLVGERERTGRIDLGHFYARRARRLLPALLLVLLAVSLWVAAGGSGIDAVSLRNDVLATLAYAANWRLVLSHQGYFAQFTLPSPLRHAWSLAIEEQYYLLWPPLLLGLVRLGRGSRRVALRATIVLASLSAGAMALLYHPGVDPSRIYYGTDTRAFELLIGAALALLTTGRGSEVRSRWSNTVGLAALAGFAWLALSVTDNSAWMYRGGFLLAALLVAATIWSVGRLHSGPLGAALSFGPLQWIGRLSYGIYLWHWPVIDLLTRSRSGLSGSTLLIAQVAVILGASALSYYALEQPVRSGRVRLWPALVAVPLTASILVVSLLAPVAVRVRVAAPARLALIGLSAPGPGATTPAVGSSGAGTTSAPLASGPALPAAGGWPAPSTTAVPTAAPLGLTGVRTATSASPLRVLVVGDSVMWDASLGIKAALEATGAARVDVQAVLGFGLSTSAYRWRTKWPVLVASDRPDLVIAMFGGWDGTPAVAKGAAWYRDLVEQAVQVLTAGGARLVFLEYPRNQPPDFPGLPPVDQSRIEQEREVVNQTFLDAAARHAGGVGYLPVGPVLDLNGRYTAFRVGSDGTLERLRKHDNIHICPAGAAVLGEWVLRAVTDSFGLPTAGPAWPNGTWQTDHRYNTPSGACA